MDVQQRHNLTIVFSFLAAIFCAVCYAGAKGKVPWTELKITQNGGSSSTLSGNGEIRYWFGLLGADTKTTTSITIAGNTIESSFEKYVEYSDDFLEDCKTAGEVVISFATFGLIASLALVVFAQARKGASDGFMKRMLAVAAAGAGGVFFLICWSTYLEDCHEKINDKFDDAKLHAGWAMSFLGCIMMGIGFINELCVPAGDAYIQG